ncbi:hypothetical protein CW304_19695 [Bacillus sp. UFRGS-B20]|nr:hypothetical protein CW304_19695 [Bacillus sp. UFRGS-B20]
MYKAGNIFPLFVKVRISSIKFTIRYKYEFSVYASLISLLSFFAHYYTPLNNRIFPLVLR